ncbi:MAG: hypothetical protein M0R66_00375 [Candidatus Omnitrophica bacterium]|jgi:thymidine kinase|nr:hypothetical protein [Candidatus Omnitrophota bacterium]
MKRRAIIIMSVSRGNLHLIIGPMFSGKSSLMLGAVERYARAGRKCIIIRHGRDHRDGERATMRTHAGHIHDMVPIARSSSLTDAETARAIDASDVIGVDEMQFFAMYDEDIARAVASAIEEWLLRGKIIICAGLDADWQREPFAVIALLVCAADRVTKLLAVCTRCGADAQCSARTLFDDAYSDPVGGREKYEAQCRECYRAAM